MHFEFVITATACHSASLSNPLHQLWGVFGGSHMRIGVSNYEATVRIRATRVAHSIGAPCHWTIPFDDTRLGRTGERMRRPTICNLEQPTRAYGLCCRGFGPLRESSETDASNSMSKAISAAVGLMGVLLNVPAST